jgi:hypothetical protein
MADLLYASQRKRRYLAEFLAGAVVRRLPAVSKTDPRHAHSPLGLAAGSAHTFHFLPGVRAIAVPLGSHFVKIAYASLERQ